MVFATASFTFAMGTVIKPDSPWAHVMTHEKKKQTKYMKDLEEYNNNRIRRHFSLPPRSPSRRFLPAHTTFMHSHERTNRHIQRT
jgi:hypothetical protein